MRTAHLLPSGRLRRSRHCAEGEGSGADISGGSRHFEASRRRAGIETAAECAAANWKVAT
jgi:hypothetical protein